MMNLKSCPFGEFELKSLHYHVGLGKALAVAPTEDGEAFLENGQDNFTLADRLG